MDHVLSLLIFLMAGIARFSKGFAGLGIGSYEEWKPGDKIKILLVGYNGARNTGSDVRVAVIAKQIGELFGKDNVHITVMTLDAASLAGYFDKDVELLPFSSLFPLDLYRACCTHHAAILCEGSTLKSTFANGLTLFMGEAAGIMKSQKKPCLAYGSEVGEMEPFLTRAVKRLCSETYFITRTEKSLAALNELGLHGHAGTDAAWHYDGAILTGEAKHMLREQGWDGEKPLLGIAVIDPFCWPVRASMGKWIKGHLTGDLSGQYDHWYFFSDSPSRREKYDNYIREVALGINSYLKEKDYYPVLIGMERLDEKAVRDLRSRLETESAVFLSSDHTASIMTGVLRELSALVTSRYHAAVLSMETGCPIIAISMDERLDSIMKELSYDGSFILHVGEEELGQKIERALSLAETRKNKIQERTLRYASESKRKLSAMGNFMKDYLETKLRAQENASSMEEIYFGRFDSFDRGDRLSGDRDRGRTDPLSGGRKDLRARESSGC